MNRPLLLALASVVVGGLGACTPERTVIDKPPGTYQSTVRSTDAYGTTTERQTQTQVSQDAQGNKTAVVKSKTTQDPKGLFNKTTTSKTTAVIEEDE